LSPSMHEMANIAINAYPQRAPWVLGHYLMVKANLERPTTREEVEELWRTFEAPAAIQGNGANEAGYLPQRYPIEVLPEDGAMIRNGRLVPQHPMRVMAHLIKVHPDSRQIEYTASGDNLELGAVGSIIMNILYAQAK